MAGLHSTLIQAIYDNDIEVINQLLPKTDIYYNDDELLRVAARVGNLGLVEKLIEMGCDISARNWEVLANITIVKFLLREGKLSKHITHIIESYDGRGSRESIRNIIKLVMPYCCVPFHFYRSAAVRGHYKIITLLFSSSSRAENQQALKLAASNGHCEVVKLLLPYSNPRSEGSYAFRRAAEKGHLNVVRLLLPHSNPRAGGSYALRYAAEEGRREIVKLLLPYINPKAGNSEALKAASTFCHFGIIKLLLPYSNLRVKDSRALKFAVRGSYFSHPKVVKLLLPYSS